MASLLLRSYLARTSALKRTALVVFYDVKTAFYAVIRKMLLPVPPSREEYLDMLDSVDIPLPLVPILRQLWRVRRWCQKSLLTII